MVLSREKLVLWLLTVLIIGLALGYLFSSKFCKVSINKRVDKITELNQELRRLLVHHTVWTYHSLESDFLEYEDQQAAAEQLAKNDTELASLFASYYGQSTKPELITLLQTQKNNLDAARAQIVSGQSNTVSFKQTEQDLAYYLQQLKVLPVDAQEFARLFISDLGTNFIEIIKAWKSKNWQRAFSLYETNLEISRESADLLDRLISEEFPYKF
jgi:ferric iron reductase protein FhuF